MQFLTGETEIEKISVEQVKYLADEYPFFSIAQFILAKKLKDDKSSEYLSQLQKSALYFTNPHWLNYQLNSISKPAAILFLSETTIESEALNETPTEATKKTILSTAEDKTDEEMTVDDFESLQKDEPAVEETPINENVKEADEETDNIESLTKQTFEEANEEHSIKSLHENNALINDVENIEEIPVAESKVEEIPDSSIEKKLESSEIVDDYIQPQEETKEVQLIDTNPIISATEIAHKDVIEEMASIQDKAEEINQAEEKETEVKNEPEEESIEIVVHEEAIVAMDEHEQMFQNIKALLDSASQEANAGTGNIIIPIDPYHTIDYFASQGINVDLDKNPQDQLSKNLKKFTHWLRHMKKLGPEDSIPASDGSETETEIQKIADSSNSIKEIVTEAMAQVLEKQGKKEKAIELYNKLSFLYPHKIPYFADQIKKLKGD